VRGVVVWTRAGATCQASGGGGGQLAKKERDGQQWFLPPWSGPGCNCGGAGDGCEVGGTGEGVKGLAKG
jgi:hypothetical protein